jgi:hypothetical protein
MESVLSDYIATDDLTILLALIAAAVFLLHNLYKPQALVHPILLGRQSDVARVRNPGESAIYRNYVTGLTGRVRVVNASCVHYAKRWRVMRIAHRETAQRYSRLVRFRQAGS